MMRKGFRRYWKTLGVKRGLILLRASPKTVLAGNVSPIVCFRRWVCSVVGISLSEGEGASYYYHHIFI